ncbi:MAG: hypothetical protein AB7F89_19595 [Pirellulaceae bacterium]
MSRWNFRPFEIETSNTANTVRKMEARALVCLAGPQAEYQFCKSVGRRFSNAGSKSDYDLAVDLVFALSSGEGELQPYYALIDVRARNLIRNRWREVETLAHALMERKEMTGDEVSEVIRSCRRRRRLTNEEAARLLGINQDEEGTQ